MKISRIVAFDRYVFSQAWFADRRHVTHKWSSAFIEKWICKYYDKLVSFSSETWYKHKIMVHSKINLYSNHWFTQISERLSRGFMKQSLWQRGKQKLPWLLILIRGDYKCQFTYDYKDIKLYNQNKVIWRHENNLNSRIW